MFTLVFCWASAIFCLGFDVLSGALPQKRLTFSAVWFVAVIAFVIPRLTAAWFVIVFTVMFWPVPTVLPIRVVSLTSLICFASSSPNSSFEGPGSSSLKQRVWNSCFSAGFICSRLRPDRSAPTCPNSAFVSTPAPIIYFRAETILRYHI